MKRLLIIVILGLILMACEPVLVHGVVTDKRYEPAYSRTIQQRVGKVLVPVTYDYPEKYEIKFFGNDGCDYWIEVNKEQYESTKINEDFSATVIPCGVN